MKILVCITHVPDTTSKISFTDGDTKFNPQGLQYIIGPYDEYALSKAIDIRDSGIGGTITVVNVGTAESEPTIRKALAIGADDAIRVDSAPESAFFVATQLADIVKSGVYDMILMGRESIDFNGNQVHTLVAEMLGIPCVTPIMKLDVQGNKALVIKEIEGGKQLLEVEMPFVAGCQEPIAEWKIPNMRGIMSAKTKPLHVVPPIAIHAEIKTVKYSLPTPRSGVKLIDSATPEKLWELLKNEAKVL